MGNNNQNQNENQSKQILLSVLAIAILVVAVVGVSFAAFTYSKTGQKENTITTGTITMEYTEDTNGINITNAMPVDEATGKAITASDAGKAGTAAEGAGVFDFTVQATISGDVTIPYEVSARKLTVDTADGTTIQLPDENIRLYLEKDTAGGDSYTEVSSPAAFSANGTGESGVGTPTTNMVLDSGSFTRTQTIKYRLRMWVDQAYVVTDKKAQYKVAADFYGKAQ